MKRVAIAIMIAVAISLIGEIATARTYTVLQGDCLSVIGAKLSVNWKKMAADNNISSPYIIYPGQKLIVSDDVDVKVVKVDHVVKTKVDRKEEKHFEVKHLGRNKFRGQGNYDLAWKQFSLTPSEAKEIADKIFAGDFRWGRVKKGDTFDLGLEGKNVLRENPRMSWVDHDDFQEEAARVYSISSGKKEIWIIIKCGNPYLKIKKSLAVTIVTRTPQEKIEKRGVKTTGDFVYIPPTKTEMVIEHEPIVGAWVWGNKLSEGWGVYGEYIAWLRERSMYGLADGWSPGLGIYGIYSEGHSKNSSYSWIEGGIGPQFGVKYTDPDFQFQAKVRLVWEEMSGSNLEGYSMTQNNLKIGGYTEYLDWRHKKDGWFWGATGEFWYALDKSRTSTWIGDSPSRRGQIAVGPFIQFKLDDDWQARFRSNIFYQAWDHLTGLNLGAELRWKETVMFGPWVSVFPFGLSNVYDGVATAGDLTTYGLGVRVEFAELLRWYDRRQRVNAIKEADRAWLDKLLKENNLPARQ